MRKNLMRIVSLALAFALVSVSAFALGGDYDNAGTFTVTGAEGALQTSLIIVSGSHSSLPVENEAVTGAIYIDQVASDAVTGDAAFTGVALTDADVHTAFFSNESENSASSAKIVNASIAIAADVTEVEAGQTVTFAVTKTASVTDANTVAYVNGEVAELGGTLSEGLTFTPAEAGTYNVQLKATVEGVEVASAVVAITVTAPPVVLDPVVIEGDDTILDLVKSPTSDYSAQPVGIKVSFGEGEKTINKMKWVFEADDEFYFSADAVQLGIKVTGDAAFAAVVKNGAVVDGEFAGDAIEIDNVGAIFDVDGQDYYTNEAYGAFKDAE